MAQNEKRRAHRRRVQIPVLCWESEEERESGKGVEIASKDLSGDGIAFYTKRIYPIDKILYIDIYLPNQKAPVSCKLKVVSVEALLRGEQYLVGGAFLDLNP